MFEEFTDNDIILNCRLTYDTQKILDTSHLKDRLSYHEDEPYYNCEYVVYINEKEIGRNKLEGVEASVIWIESTYILSNGLSMSRDLQTMIEDNLYKLTGSFPEEDEWKIQYDFDLSIVTAEISNIKTTKL